MPDAPTRHRLIGILAWMHAVVRPLLDLVEWFADASGLAVAVVRQGVRPVTWRRPVRTEFARFMEFSSLSSVPSVAIAGALVGFAVVTQGLYWVGKVGQEALLSDVFQGVIVRELAPLLVGFLVLGRSGLVILDEIGTLRRGGQFRMLDAQGIDPFLVLIVPRVLALTLSMFALTIVFVITCFLFGHLAALAIGLKVGPVYTLPVVLLNAVGSAGYATLPVKTLTIGFTIGVVCCLTAMESRPEGGGSASLMPRGFIRAVLAVFVVSGLTSVLL